MIDCTKLKEYKIEDLLGEEINCSCGQIHTITTEKIFIGKDASSHLIPTIKEFTSSNRILVITCLDIYENISKPLIQNIKNRGYDVNVHIYPTEFHPTLEKTQELFAHDNKCDLVVSIGSGCVTDCSKYFAARNNLKLISVATAPSMDGYISNASVILVNGIKDPLPSKSPEALICDTDIIATAPKKMIASGYGDVVSKYTSIFDWKVAHYFTGEHYCEHIADLTIESAKQAFTAAQKIVNGDKDGVEELTYALIVSSVAMQLLKSTRCASGGEHSCAHAYGMLCRSQKIEDHLHGEDVFLFFAKLINIYKGFYSSELSFPLVKPDIQNRYDMLISKLGVNQDVAKELLSNNINKEQLGEFQKIFKEKQDVLYDYIAQISELMEETIQLYYKLYDGIDGNWIDEVSDDDLQTSIYMASEVKPRFVTLTLMKHLGRLEICR